MSLWQDFLEQLSGKHRNDDSSEHPGEVMICFVNRYLEALDGIRYQLKFDQSSYEGKTTEQHYCVRFTPESLDPIRVFVWSRARNGFKELDSVTPNLGKELLVRKVLKTYKTRGKTEQHPRNQPIAKPPAKPTPAPAAGPSPTTGQGVKPIPQKDESGLPQTKVERAVPDKITKEQLKKIFPAAKLDYLQQVADELNKDLVKFKLDTPIRRAHFFGQVRQEAGSGAKGTVESFNYNANGLIQTFGYYKKNQDEAKHDGRQEESIPGKKKKKIKRAAKEEVIANKVYGKKGVAKALGNEEDEDGWRFRGRGLKQLTGRSNYKAFTKKHTEYWGEATDFCTQPDLVAEFPYTVRSAVAFWLANKCWDAADKGINDAAIDEVTTIVNSGEIRNHNIGAYAKDNNPVLNRRNYTKLAYSAFV